MLGIFVTVLLLGGQLAAAICRTQEQGPYDQGYFDNSELEQGQCRRCSADNLLNSTCLECWCGYSLSNTGTCVQCAQARCCECDPERPNFCIRCLWEGFAGDECVYYDGQGNCLLCPEHDCMKADHSDPSGACIECNSGYGLMPDGTCKPCKDPGCQQCDGDATTCQECKSGSFLIEGGKCKMCPAECYSCEDESTCTGCVPGFTLEEASKGACVPCDATSCDPCPYPCLSCNAKGDCLACSEGYALAAASRCLECPSLEGGCATCRADGSTAVCTECMPGYFLSAGANACISCPEYCVRCTDATTCIECDSLGVALDNSTGQCVPCSLPGCSHCPDGPATCSRCLWWKGFTITEQGCVRCSDPAAIWCAMGNPDISELCLQPLEANGVHLGIDATLGTCKPCEVANCTGCSADTSSCRGCAEGLSPSADGNACLPCAAQHCIVCSQAWAEAGRQRCEVCAAGYTVTADRQACVLLPPEA